MLDLRLCGLSGICDNNPTFGGLLKQDYGRLEQSCAWIGGSWDSYGAKLKLEMVS